MARNKDSIDAIHEFLDKSILTTTDKTVLGAINEIESELAGLDTSTRTFTNKTIEDYTNHIHADVVHKRAKATANILKGQPVVVTGYNAGESAQEVALANQATGVATGVAYENMAIGEFGLIVTQGILTDINTIAFAEGSILYVDGTGAFTTTEPATGFMQPIAYVLRSHTVNGAIQVNASYPKQSADDVRFTSVSGTIDSTKVDTAIEEVKTASARRESGFVNNTDSTLSFDNGTRTFTITPTGASFTYTINGKEVVVSGAKSIQISIDVGEHFIYFDDETATLKETITMAPSLIYQYAYVSSLYWNGSEVVVLGEERHGNIMDAETHSHLHLSLGTQYISGLAISNSGNNISSTDGIIRDEDIRIVINPQTTFYKIWRIGASGVWTKSATADALPYTIDGGTGRVLYNLFSGGTWTTTPVPVSDFCNILIFATNDVRTGHQLVCILDDTVHNTVNEAIANIDNEVGSLVAGGLNFQEFVPIAIVTVNAAGTIQQITDIRQSEFRGSGSFTSHNSLGALQGGTTDQYYHLTLAELSGLQNLLITEEW